MEQIVTILIVDDDPDGREVLRALLEDQGYHLTFASSGGEALVKAANTVPDLILMDVMMPGMDGFTVCRQLRANPYLAEVPIILLTALDDSDARLQGIEAGADDFVSKLIGQEELRARVRTITRLNRYRRLLQERARFERVVELLPNGLLIVNAALEIELANPALVRMLGMSGRESLVGRPLADLLVPDQLDDFTTLLREVLELGQAATQVETVFRTVQGGELPAEIDAGPLTWDAGPAVQVVVRDIAERRWAAAQIQRQLQRLAALRTIDMSITSSLDLRLTLNVLLDQVMLQLRPDAATVLLLNPITQTLHFSVGRGFRSDAIAQRRTRLGEGQAGQAALERTTIRLTEIDQALGELDWPAALRGEGFTVAYAVPLVAKGQVKGVLELFYRVPIITDPQWHDFLETLAGQAAIAIDYAEVFSNLQRSNTELTLAYDTTLEGWVRALDLRDKETEGHTLRVTEMTVTLARQLGLSDEELVQLRRGALLHDIGKMGIPDAILLKHGPLTTEEWEIMRRHPTYAFEMLSPITFLRPALAIPYCHHEKWDGSGYPHGLSGEQIPFAARIFAVVDVWVALTSNRPYRTAWSHARTLEYIQAQSGTHFDPLVVAAFLKMLAGPEVANEAG